MYPAQCVGQCCDARAKQERALLDFIVKGSGPPPHTTHYPTGASSTGSAFLFVRFQNPTTSSVVSVANYIVYHYHPRDCPAPLFKCPVHTSCTPSSKYNGQGFPHARGPLECTKRARSPTPPPRPVRLEPDRSART